MIIDDIKNKYPKLTYILLSSIIFIFIAKHYAFSLYVVNYGESIPFNINAPLVYGYRLLLIALILFTKWSLYDIVLFGIGCLMTLVIRNSMFVTFFILGIYCKTNKISSNYLVKNYFFITSFFFLGMIVLNTLNIIPNGIDVHFRNNVARNDFGFGNPNAPFLASLPLYAGYIYLRYDKYDIYDRVLLIAVSLLIYSQTYSRTGLITILGILLFIEIIKKSDIRDNKCATIFLTCIPLSITLFSFFTAKVLNIRIINKILSNRPMLWNIYIDHIKILKNNYYFTLRENYPLDNTYIFSFVLYGIVITLIWLIIYTYFMNKSALSHDGKSLAVCSIFLIYAFGENMLFNTGLNFTFILAISSINLKNTHLYLNSILKNSKLI